MPDITVSLLLQIYGGVIVLFGVIYYLLWEFVPHEFIVGQEVNIARIGAVNSSGQDVPEEAAAANAAHRLFKVENERRTTTASLNGLREDWEATNREFQQKLGQHDAATSANMRKHMEENRKSYSEAMERLSKEELPPKIASMTAGRITEEELDSWHAARVEHISKEYAFAGNPADYHDADLADAADRLNRKLIDIEGKVIDESNKYADKSEEIRKLQKVLSAKLNLVDMIYFSLGIATTINFEDIVPNSTKVRFVVMLQVGICIFLVGLIINLISEKF